MTPELLIAAWQLGAYEPDTLPGLAADLLSRGYETPALVELAGLIQPTRDDVAPLAQHLMAELALPPITHERAGRVLAAEWARQIVTGTLAPARGAAQIWRVAYYACGQPDDLLPFVGLASQYEDSPEYHAALDEDIRQAAGEYLRSAAEGVA